MFLNSGSTPVCSNQTSAQISQNIETLQGQIEAAMNMEEAIDGMAKQFGIYIIEQMHLSRAVAGVKYSLPGMKKELAGLHKQLQVVEKYERGMAKAEEATSPHDTQYEEIVDPTT